MFGLNVAATPALRRLVFLSVLALAGCGGANSCCTVPGGVGTVGGVIPPGSSAIVPTVPAITIGNGGNAAVPVVGTGPFTSSGCPGIVNATVTGNIVNLVGVGLGVCVVVVGGPGAGQGTITVTVAGAPPLVVAPGTISLLPGGTGGITVTGPGPFTATGCPGIVNATVTGNVVNLVAVGAGVCAVVIVGPNGVQATVVTTVSAAAPLAIAPGTILLGNGGTGSIPITGTGPFTATGCPGIINATVAGNVLNLAAVGAGVCVVVVTGPGGVTATVVATVAAAAPLVVTPTTINLGTGGAGSIGLTGPGPFTATGCPGIINATVVGNVVNLVAVGAGVCAVVIVGPGGVQATVLATVAASAPLALLPTTVMLGNGGTTPIAITGTGPFTATGCPGIINATVTGNVLNLAAVGVGACVVVVTGPGGVHATVLATVSAAAPIALLPTTLALGNGGVAPITIVGAGPFTATGCPGIVNATVVGNVLNLAAVGAGVCAVIVTGPGGVQAAVLTTVTAAAPLVLLPTTVGLVGVGSTAPVTVTGAGPFTATGCAGIVSATVLLNVVTVKELGVGVCAVVIAGAGGIQSTVLVTAT